MTVDEQGNLVSVMADQCKFFFNTTTREWEPDNRTALEAAFDTAVNAECRRQYGKDMYESRIELHPDVAKAVANSGRRTITEKLGEFLDDRRLNR